MATSAILSSTFIQLSQLISSRVANSMFYVNGEKQMFSRCFTWCVCATNSPKWKHTKVFVLMCSLVIMHHCNSLLIILKCCTKKYPCNFSFCSVLNNWKLGERTPHLPILINFKQFCFHICRTLKPWLDLLQNIWCKIRRNKWNVSLRRAFIFRCFDVTFLLPVHVVCEERIKIQLRDITVIRFWIQQ